MTQNKTWGPDTTADEVLAGTNLTGKCVLITGGSGGIGAETARALAATGAQVTVTARDLGKVRGVVESIRADTGASVAVGELELGSLASIRAFAERFVAEHDKLDILINNAGVMACPQSTTQDGFELQFGSNHLGHFLLTSLVAPKLISGARIVSLSSAAHQISPVVFEDIQFERRPYDKWLAYGQSKTANALFAVGLNTRLKSRAIEAFSVHPGMIQTDLMRHQSEEDRARSRAMRDSGKVKYKTVQAGAATSVYAATAPELAGHGGAYLADCAIAQVSADAPGFSVVRPFAVDPDAAERLWAVSEQLLGLRFG